MTAAELPDPIAFAADALSATGALVERVEGGLVALLSAGDAATLGIPEDCTLVDALAPEQAGAIACGIGSPLLERLSERARAQIPVAAVSVDLDAPRATHARTLAERVPLRNVVFDVADVAMLPTIYLVAWVAWTAEADDRYEGMVSVVIHTVDGAEPDDALVPLAVGALAVPSVAASARAESGPVSARILDRIGRRAMARASVAVEPGRVAVARRHARDHQRIDEYFAALAADARSPKRRVDAAAVKAKLEHLRRERDAKLADLRDRYALRVTLDPVAFAWLSVPAAHVRLRVRRRKREGELTLRLPAGAHALDRVACAACERPTARPAFCDDALHPLCETCVPSVQGRPDCRACAARGANRS